MQNKDVNLIKVGDVIRHNFTTFRVTELRSDRVLGETFDGRVNIPNRFIENGGFEILNIDWDSYVAQKIEEKRKWIEKFGCD